MLFFSAKIIPTVKCCLAPKKCVAPGPTPYPAFLCKNHDITNILRKNPKTVIFLMNNGLKQQLSHL